MQYGQLEIPNKSETYIINSFTDIFTEMIQMSKKIIIFANYLRI